MFAGPLAVAVPVLVAGLLAVSGSPRQGAWVSLVAVATSFMLALAAALGGPGPLHADALGLGFGVLTGFIGLVTALQNVDFVTAAAATLSLRRWRAYHALGLIMFGAVLLGLYADNIGLLWLAMGIATVAGALAAGLRGTTRALRAAWTCFILGSAGIGVALFGTMLVYLAAQPAIGQGLAMSFAGLGAHAAGLDGKLLTLAFVFLLLGYGAAAGLVPLHGWLPDAWAESPGPLTRVTSALTLNVALIAILRFRHLAQTAGAMPGAFLLALGMASLALPAIALAWRRDVPRFIGAAAIAQSGLAVFAFGLGGATAIFGGLLNMALGSLITSAALSGVFRANPRRGWLPGATMFALAALPPSGLFASAFIIVSQTIQRDPWLSGPLGLFMSLGAIAALRRVGRVLVSPARRPATGWDIALSALPLAGTVALAFLMPPALVDLLSRIAAGLA